MNAQLHNLPALLKRHRLPAIAQSVVDARLASPSTAVALRNMTTTLATQRGDTPMSRERLEGAYRFFRALSSAASSGPEPGDNERQTSRSATQAAQSHPHQPVDDLEARRARQVERLAEINARLRALQLAEISLEEAIRLGRAQDPQELQNALQYASLEPALHQWLRDVLDAIRAPTRSSAGSAPATARAELPPARAPEAAHSAADEQNAPSESREFAERKGFYVYGGAGALNFVEWSTRERRREAAQDTVLVEAAHKLPGAGRNDARRYDWARGRKISLMLMPRELWAVLCVALGFVPSARFANHGDGTANKWFEVSRQASQLFWVMGEGKSSDRKPVSVPIDDYHVTRLVRMLLRQIRRNEEDPWMSASDIFALARTAYAPLFQASPGERERRSQGAS